MVTDVIAVRGRVLAGPLYPQLDTEDTTKMFVDPNSDGVRRTTPGENSATLRQAAVLWHVFVSLIVR